MAIEVVQINLNHCYDAQQLLWKSAADWKCDVAMIAEPYRIPTNNDNWVSDCAGLTAIQVLGRHPIQEVISRTHEGFVVAKIADTYFCSVYAPPSWSLDQFHEMLESLTEVLLGRNPVVIGGDFNAWSTDWGSRFTNHRGRSLNEALATLDVCLLNEGTSSTCRRPHLGAESIVDITFCSLSLYPYSNWRVCEDYSASDHQAIRFCIGQRPRIASDGSRASERRWKWAMFDKDLFVEAFCSEVDPLPQSVDELDGVMARACDATMPRSRVSRFPKRAVYWWNETIANLRANCLRARRRAQRARSPTSRELLMAELRLAKASLKKEIKLSKANCFKELCQETEANPWGNAYRITMARLKGPAAIPERDPQRLRHVIRGLFPEHEQCDWPPAPYIDDASASDESERVTNEELLLVVKTLKSRKAPGPDGLPNVALKAAVQAAPDIFRRIMQKCLEEGYFPDRWKKSKLVLLPKPGKPAGEPSSYRPICLLDTLGKLLERLLLNRLARYTEGPQGLSDNQFGFRKGRSTIDAINLVIECADKAHKRRRNGERFCAIVTIDVKNAFNSANWTAIARSLHRMQVPEYLCKILRSYFVNRVLTYDTNEGQKSMAITAGVPAFCMY